MEKEILLSDKEPCWDEYLLDAAADEYLGKRIQPDLPDPIILR